MINLKTFATLEPEPFISNYPSAFGAASSNYNEHVIPALRGLGLDKACLEIWDQTLIRWIKSYDSLFRIRHIFEREILPLIITQSHQSLESLNEQVAFLIDCRQRLEKLFASPGVFFNSEKILIRLISDTPQQIPLRTAFSELWELLELARSRFLLGPLQSRAFSWLIYLSIEIQKIDQTLRLMTQLSPDQNISALMAPGEAWQHNHRGQFSPLKDNCPYAEATLIQALEENKFVLINQSFIQKFVNARTALYIGPNVDGFRFGYWYETQNTRKLQAYMGQRLQQNTAWQIKRESRYLHEELCFILLGLALKGFIALNEPILHSPLQTQHKA